MIIDRILDRYNGDDYRARDFYGDVLAYGGSGISISKAMDFGTEEDVKEELCKYIDTNQYNSRIKEFINKAEWLLDDNGTDWKEVIEI